MEFTSLSGKKLDVKISKYYINWDEKSLSKFQYAVKQFLKPFWYNDLCFEEFKVAGSNMRIDIFNLSKRIAVECQGEQHEDPKSFFHANYESYRKQLKRDVEKERFCVLNKIQLVEIYELDLPLTKEFFKDKYKITL